MFSGIESHSNTLRSNPNIMQSKGRYIYFFSHL